MTESEFLQRQTLNQGLCEGCLFAKLSQVNTWAKVRQGRREAGSVCVNGQAGAVGNRALLCGAF